MSIRYWFIIAFFACVSGCKKGNFHKAFETGKNKVWTLQTYRFPGSDNVDPIVTELTLSLNDGQGKFESCNVAEHYSINDHAIFNLKPGDISIPENNLIIDGIFGKLGNRKRIRLDLYQDDVILNVVDGNGTKKSILYIDIWYFDKSRTESGKPELYIKNIVSEMIFTLEDK